MTIQAHARYSFQDAMSRRLVVWNVFAFCWSLVCVCVCVYHSVLTAYTVQRIFFEISLDGEEFEVY